jgi:predicted RNase H-like HicB family nuclease
MNRQRKEESAMDAARVFQVSAMWDPEAEVWVATSEDVPGLATEADRYEDLIAKLRVMIPELLEANGFSQELRIPFEVSSVLREYADRARA